MHLPVYSRRLFLSLAAATPLLRSATFSKPIGINLFTVRDSLSKDPSGTYQALAEMGVRQLEVRANHLEDHANMIRSAGLQPVHMFIEYPTISGDWTAVLERQRAMARRMNRPEPDPNQPRPNLKDSAAMAKEFGISRLGLSSLQGAEGDAAIRGMNEAVDYLEGQGMGFYYHNHASEFDASSGTSFFDRLFATSDKRLKIELDVFWSYVGGQDNVALLNKWKGRVASLHVKDVEKGTPRQNSERNIPRTAFKEVGAGILDWPRLLKAAEDAGTEFYLIEQDSTPGDPLVSVRQSVDFLKQVQVG
jgi:sugar phosphate isomerase/epimerase